MDHALRFTRVKLLQIESKRHEQLLTIAQPVDQHLGGQDFDERLLVLRWALPEARFARRIGARFYDVGLLVASAASIWFRSWEKSTGFAW